MKYISNIKFTSIFIVLFLSISAYSQISKEYLYQGAYKGKSAQGMAIHKNYAFLLNDGGYCRMYNLNKNTLISEFNLASSTTTNHANCASFGSEYPSGNKSFPAIYISECFGQSRCFVESINDKGSTLIQTIQLKIKNSIKHTDNWYIDSKKKYLYTITRVNKDIDSLGTKKHTIIKLPLPSLKDSIIIFSEKDILDQFEIEFPNLLQGGTIKDNYLYIPVGLHKQENYKTRKDRQRAIIIVNLSSKTIEKIINIESLIHTEPEDIDFHKKKLLIYCGQEGGLYKIPKNNLR